MKSILIPLIAACIIQVCCAMTMEQIGRHVIRRTGCLKKENLTLDAVEAFTIQGKLADAEVNPGLKCFGACVMELHGIIDGCKVLDREYAKIQELAEFHKMLVTCKPHVNAGERCECSYQLMKCFHEHGMAQIDMN